MNTSIMVGNGINRCVSETDISWGNLLKDIARLYDVTCNEKLSFPMQFETIVNQILKNNVFLTDEIYDDVKKEMLKKLELDKITDVLLRKKIFEKADSILTTNYDLSIEKSVDENIDISKQKMNWNNKYNLNTPIVVNEKEIYHIHGDVRSSKSICLGYEHYCGGIENIRGKIKSKNATGNIHIEDILSNPNIKSTFWVDKFFTDNIFILGLGLTQSELDIWWVLTYRAYLYYTNLYGAKKLMKNKVIYYDIDKEENEELRFSLENLNVKYEFIKIPSNVKDVNKYYYNTYLKILDEI